MQELEKDFLLEEGLCVCSQSCYEPFSLTLGMTALSCTTLYCRLFITYCVVTFNS